MPFETYIGYLADASKETRGEVAAGEPFVIELRDLDTFERLVVRAIVAAPGEALEGGDQLWVLDWIENRIEEPWSVKVLEELDEEQEAAARADITEADLAAASKESTKYGTRRYAGSQLPDAMGQEEARKFYEHVTGKPQPK